MHCVLGHGTWRFGSRPFNMPSLLGPTFCPCFLVNIPMRIHYILTGRMETFWLSAHGLPMPDTSSHTPFCQEEGSCGGSAPGSPHPGLYHTLGTAFQLAVRGRSSFGGPSEPGASGAVALSGPASCSTVPGQATVPDMTDHAEILVQLEAAQAEERSCHGPNSSQQARAFEHAPTHPGCPSAASLQESGQWARESGKAGGMQGSPQSLGQHNGVLPRAVGVHSHGRHMRRSSSVGHRPSYGSAGLLPVRASIDVMIQPELRGKLGQGQQGETPWELPASGGPMHLPLQQHEHQLQLLTAMQASTSCESGTTAGTAAGESCRLQGGAPSMGHSSLGMSPPGAMTMEQVVRDIAGAQAVKLTNSRFRFLPAGEGAWAVPRPWCLHAGQSSHGSMGCYLEGLGRAAKGLERGTQHGCASCECRSQPVPYATLANCPDLYLQTVARRRQRCEGGVGATPWGPCGLVPTLPRPLPRPHTGTSQPMGCSLVSRRHPMGWGQPM